MRDSGDDGVGEGASVVEGGVDSLDVGVETRCICGKAIGHGPR